MTEKTYRRFGVQINEKDSQIQIRLPEYEKTEFIKICAQLDSTASREIRIFIREFLQKHNQRTI